MFIAPVEFSVDPMDQRILLAISAATIVQSNRTSSIRLGYGKRNKILAAGLFYFKDPTCGL